MSWGGAPKKGGWANPGVKLSYTKEQPKPKPEPKIEVKSVDGDESLQSPVVSDTLINGKRIILLQDGAVIEYFPKFLSEEEANAMKKELLDTMPWGEHKIFSKASQKWVDQPRLVSWVAEDKTFDYTYSGLTLNPYPPTRAIKEMKQRIEALSPGNQYDGVLVNNYRNGKDSINWHSDDEATLVVGSTIASVSLGCTREFVLRHKTKKLQHLVLPLTNGSLLLMKTNVQKYYLHAVPKVQNLCKIHFELDNYGLCTCKNVQRLNLTFRHYKREEKSENETNTNNQNGY